MSKARDNFGHIAEAMTSLADASTHTAAMAKAAQANCEEGSDKHTEWGKTFEKHACAAEKCVKCAQRLNESMKADGGDELEPLPDGFSKTGPPPHIKMVPRTGQREPTAATNPVFAEIFADSVPRQE